MSRTRVFLNQQAAIIVLASVSLCPAHSLADALATPHLSVPQRGGFPGLPVMTGIRPTTNGVTITWDGPQGYYQILQKLTSKDAKWQALGGHTNLGRTATIPTVSSNALFRVSGPAPQYAGSETCLECHQPVHDAVRETRHAQAFAALKAVNQDQNASCLPCHTVGFGLPSGFVSEAATPQLAGVQCENCHGPAANHAANPEDPIARPRVELAGEMCGGCHNAQLVPAGTPAPHPPTYEDWNTAAHRAVLPELQADFTGTNGPAVFIPSCGRCHSGSVREALLDNQALPDGQEAAAVGITCATCHDPHEVQVHTNVLYGEFSFTNRLTGGVVKFNNHELGPVYTNQVRNPLASVKDYVLRTSDVFADKYDPTINICGQCHNHRGAAWTTSSRSPHHSPQYNILLGTVGELPSGMPPNYPATHSRLEKQCVSCHMQTSDTNGPGASGHKFTVESYEVCAQCHKDAATARGLAQLARLGTQFEINYLKGLLDTWATNKAPASLQSKYGTRAWEYTNPGDLSAGGPGPTSTEQALIPVNIQKARFNLYLVLYDGSYGVHNPQYLLELLYVAETWVQDELNP